MKKYIICVLLLTSILASSIAQDLFSDSSTHKYANHLYNNYEFAMAEPEYQRLFFSDPSDSVALNRYFLCNYRLQDYSKNMRIYEKYIQTASLQFPEINEIYLRSLILTNDERIETLLPQIETPQTNYNILSYYMINGKWESANELIKDNAPCSKSILYQPILETQASYNYKKTSTAIALSTVIPGAGKAYAGYWKDALFSFVFVSLSAWQSYRGFDQKGVNSLYGWLYGGMGLGFYIGNIYGSAKAVNKHNYELDHHLQHQAEDIFINSPLQ